MSGSAVAASLNDPLQQVPSTAPSAAPGSGFGGMSGNFWNNLMNFGAQTLVAANARTGDGHLAYGSGAGGPLAAGMLGAEQQAATNAQNTTAQQTAALQNQGQQITNETNALQLPFMKARLAAYESRMAPGGGQSDAGAVPQGGVAPSDVSQAGLAPVIGGIESGGNYGAQNSAGYIGKYAFGPAALQSAGMYKPAQGENVNGNQWNGTITVPGFAPMNKAQFLANPKAQDASFVVQQNYLANQLDSAGAGQYDGQTIGGVPISPPALIAMAHFGGPSGTMKFLQTGGQYNPSDSNGISLAQYGQAAAGGMSGAAPGGSNNNLLPSGMMTPTQAIQAGTQLMSQAQTDGMIGIDNKAEMAQAQQLLNYGYGAYAPQNLRAGGAAYIPGVGIIKSSTPENVYGPGGAAIPAAETGSISLNGNPLDSPTIAPAQGMGNGGGNSAPPNVPSVLQGTNVLASSSPAGPALTEPSEITTEYLKNRSDDLATQQDELEAQADAATKGNALLDQMRGEAQTWNPDVFAPTYQAARNYMLGVADTFGITKNFPALAQTTGDYAAFLKNGGQLTQQAVRLVSPRAAVQEYQMIAKSLPNPTMGKNGLYQVMDELGGLNDYSLAKSQYAANYTQQMAATDPATQSRMASVGFTVPFNSKISPSAFIVHRMSLTPEGQQQVLGLFNNLQQTPEGKAEVARLQSQIAWGTQQGLFGDLQSGGPQ